jgi:hypothetical protein
MVKGNIPGIYNFCDRWCERCPFTSRCSMFSEQLGTSGEERSMKNKAFWDRLSTNFLKAKDMLEEAAKKSGVDLTSIKFDKKASEIQQEKIWNESLQHSIAQLSIEYDELTSEWLKTQPGMLLKLENIKEGLTLGVESEQGAKLKIETIKDSLAVIEWYRDFIHSKLMRALMAKNDDDLFDPGESSDADGSAKIALIAVDKSIQAWLKIFELLPGEEDHFLKVLASLEKIKTLTLKEFPKAMDFIRPGFDE